MNSYKQLYFYLFNTMTDALEDLTHDRIVTAIYRLQQAQQTAGEAHMELDIVPESGEC